MLKLFLEKKVLFDENTEEFVELPETTLTLEHSLISLSKWEETIKKPFLAMKEKTREELAFYVECMTISPKEVDSNIYLYMKDDVLNEVFDYVKEERTATTVAKTGERNHEVITSELIYYWMFSYQIPKECEKWHLSRLLKLIEVFSAKNQPEKKMSHRAWASKANALNRMRRAKMGSKG